MRTLRPIRLMSQLMIVITVALAGSLLVNTSSSTAATSTRSNARAGSIAAIDGSYDAQILLWTNRARAAHHLRPLASKPCVDLYAERWTVQMARYNNFSHQRLMPILRSCHRSAAAENIATGTRGISARTFVQMWMRSPGHRHNMLNPRYRYIGIAAWRSAGSGRIYATQDFTN